MAISKALYSHDSDEYETPQWLFNLLNNVFHFELDPCAKPQIESQKRIKTRFVMTQDFDGLTKTWNNYSTFVNPPYSKVRKWVEKAMIEFNERASNEKKPAPIVLLVPARTDTKWFHKIAEHPYCKLLLLKGRLKFHNTKTSAPFPSCIIILSPSSYLEKLKALTMVPTFTLDLTEYADEETEGN